MPTRVAVCALDGQNATVMGIGESKKGSSDESEDDVSDCSINDELDGGEGEGEICVEDHDEEESYFDAIMADNMSYSDSDFEPESSLNMQDEGNRESYLQQTTDGEASSRQNPHKDPSVANGTVKVKPTDGHHNLENSFSEEIDVLANSVQKSLEQINAVEVIYDGSSLDTHAPIQCAKAMREGFMTVGPGMEKMCIMAINSGKSAERKSDVDSLTQNSGPRSFSPSVRNEAVSSIFPDRSSNEVFGQCKNVPSTNVAVSIDSGTCQQTGSETEILPRSKSNEIIIDKNSDEDATDKNTGEDIIGKETDPRIIGMNSDGNVIDTNTDGDVADKNSNEGIIGKIIDHGAGVNSHEHIVDTNTDKDLTSINEAISCKIADQGVVGVNSHENIVDTNTDKDLTSINEAISCKIADQGVVGVNTHENIVDTNTDKDLTSTNEAIICKIADQGVVGVNSHENIVDTNTDKDLTSTNEAIICKIADQGVVGVNSHENIVDTNTDKDLASTNEAISCKITDQGVVGVNTHENIVDTNTDKDLTSTNDAIIRKTADQGVVGVNSHENIVDTNTDKDLTSTNDAIIRKTADQGVVGVNSHENIVDTNTDKDLTSTNEAIIRKIADQGVVGVNSHENIVNRNTDEEVMNTNEAIICNIADQNIISVDSDENIAGRNNVENITDGNTTEKIIGNFTNQESTAMNSDESTIDKSSDENIMVCNTGKEIISNEDVIAMNTDENTIDKSSDENIMVCNTGKEIISNEDVIAMNTDENTSDKNSDENIMVCNTGKEIISNEDVIAMNTDENTSDKNSDENIMVCNTGKEIISKVTNQDVIAMNTDENTIDRSSDENIMVCNTGKEIISKVTNEDVINQDAISLNTSENTIDENSGEGKMNRKTQEDIIVNVTDQDDIGMNTDENTIDKNIDEGNMNKNTQEDIVVNVTDQDDIGMNTDENTIDKSIDEGNMDKNTNDETVSKITDESIIGMNTVENTIDKNNVASILEKKTDEEVVVTDEDAIGVNVDKDIINSHLSECSRQHKNLEGMHPEKPNEDGKLSENRDKVYVHSGDDIISPKNETPVWVGDHAGGGMDSHCSKRDDTQCQASRTYVCSGDRLDDKSRGTTNKDIVSNDVVTLATELMVEESVTPLTRNGNEIVGKGDHRESSVTNVSRTFAGQSYSEKVVGFLSTGNGSAAVTETEEKDTEQLGNGGKNTQGCKRTSPVDDNEVNKNSSKCVPIIENEVSQTVASRDSCVESLRAPATIDIAPKLTIKLVKSSKSSNSGNDNDIPLSGTALTEFTNRAMDQILQCGLADALLPPEKTSHVADQVVGKPSGPNSSSSKEPVVCKIANNVPASDSPAVVSTPNSLQTESSSIVSLCGSSISKDPAFKYISTLLGNKNAKLVSSAVDSTVIMISPHEKEKIEKKKGEENIEQQKSEGKKSQSLPQKSESLPQKSESLPQKNELSKNAVERTNKTSKKEISKPARPPQAKKGKVVDKPKLNRATAEAAKRIFNGFIPIAKFPGVKTCWSFQESSMEKIGKPKKRKGHGVSSNSNIASKKKRENVECREAMNNQLETNIVCSPDKNLMINYVVHPTSKSKVSILTDDDGLLVKNTRKGEVHRDAVNKSGRRFDNTMADEAKIDWLEKQFLSENQSNPENIRRYYDALKRTLIAKKGSSDRVATEKGTSANMLKSLKTLSVKNLASVRANEAMETVCSYKDVEMVLRSFANDSQDLLQSRKVSNKAIAEGVGVTNGVINTDRAADLVGKTVSELKETQQPPTSNTSSVSGSGNSSSQPKSLKTSLRKSKTVTSKSCVATAYRRQKGLTNISTQTFDCNDSLPSIALNAEIQHITMIKTNSAPLRDTMDTRKADAMREPIKPRILSNSKVFGNSDDKKDNVCSDTNGKLQQERSCHFETFSGSKRQRKQCIEVSTERKTQESSILKPSDEGQTNLHVVNALPLSSGPICSSTPTNMLSISAAGASYWPVVSHNGTMLTPVSNFQMTDSGTLFAYIGGSDQVGTFSFPVEVAHSADSTKNENTSSIGTSFLDNDREAKEMTGKEEKGEEKKGKDIAYEDELRQIRYAKQSSDRIGISPACQSDVKISQSDISNQGGYVSVNNIGKTILHDIDTGQTLHPSNGRVENEGSKRKQAHEISEPVKSEASFKILKSVYVSPVENSTSSEISQTDQNHNYVLVDTSTRDRKGDLIYQSKPSSELHSQSNCIDPNEQVKLFEKADHEGDKLKDTDCATLTKANYWKGGSTLKRKIEELKGKTESSSDSLAQQIAKQLFVAEKKPLLQSMFSRAQREMNNENLGSKVKPHLYGKDDRTQPERSNLNDLQTKMNQSSNTEASVNQTERSGMKNKKETQRLVANPTECFGKSNLSNQGLKVQHNIGRGEEDMDIDVVSLESSTCTSPEVLAKNRIDSKMNRIEMRSLSNKSSDNNDNPATICSSINPSLIGVDNKLDLGTSKKLSDEAPSLIDGKGDKLLAGSLKSSTNSKKFTGLKRSESEARVQHKCSQAAGTFLQDSSKVCFKVLVEHLRNPEVKAALEEIIKQKLEKAMHSDTKESKSNSKVKASHAPVNSNSIVKLNVSGAAQGSGKAILTGSKKTTIPSLSSNGSDTLEARDVEIALESLVDSDSRTSSLPENDGNTAVGETNEMVSRESLGALGHAVAAGILELGRREGSNVKGNNDMLANLHCRDLSKASENMSRSTKGSLLELKVKKQPKSLGVGKERFTCREVTTWNCDVEKGKCPLTDEKEVVTTKDAERTLYVEAAVKSIVSKNLHLVSSASFVPKPVGSSNFLKPKRATLRKVSAQVGAGNSRNADNEGNGGDVMTNRKFTKRSPISSLLWRNVRYNENLIGRRRKLLEPASTLFSWECLHMFNGRKLRHDHPAIIDKLQKYEIKMRRIREHYGYLERRTYSREEPRKNKCTDGGDEEKETSLKSLRATASKCPVFSFPKDISAENRSACDILKEKAKSLSQSFFERRRSKLKWKNEMMHNRNGFMDTPIKTKSRPSIGGTPVMQDGKKSHTSVQPKMVISQLSKNTNDCTCSKVVKGMGGAVFEHSIGNLARSIAKQVGKRKISAGDENTCSKCKKVLKSAKELTRHMLYHLIDKAVDCTFDRDGDQHGIKRRKMTDLVLNRREDIEDGTDKVGSCDVMIDGTDGNFELPEKFEMKGSQIYKAQFWAKHQVPCRPTDDEKETQFAEAQEDGMLRSENKTVWTPVYFDVPVKPVKWQCLNCSKMYRSIKELKLHIDDCSRSGAEKVIDEGD